MPLQCTGRKAGRAPCKIPADRVVNGQPVCHIHDPNGKYQNYRLDHPCGHPGCSRLGRYDGFCRNHRKDSPTQPTAPVGPSDDFRAGFRRAMAMYRTFLALAKVTHPGNPWKQAIEDVERRWAAGHLDPLTGGES